MADGHGDDRWTMHEDPDPAQVSAGAEEPRETELPGLFKRAAMVILQPGALFAALGRKPAFIGIMALSAVITAAGMLAVPEEAFRTAVVEPLQGQGAGAANEEAVQAMENIPPMWFKLSGVLFPFAMAWLAPVFFAMLTWFLFRVIRRDEATFKQHLAVNAHALFIGTVGLLCTLPMWIVTQDLQSRFSVAAAAPFLADGFVHAWLSKLDLFGIWAMIVAALGLSMLDARRTWASTALTLGALWAVAAAVQTMITG